MKKTNTSYKPSVWVLPPHRDLSANYGEVPVFTDMVVDLRLASASELSFNTPAKIYDADSQEWIDNPVYEQLTEGNVLFTNWDNQIYSLAKHSIGDSSFYTQAVSSGTTTNVNFALKRDSQINNNNICRLIPRDSSDNVSRDTSLCTYTPASDCINNATIIDGVTYSGYDTLKATKDYVPTAQVSTVPVPKSQFQSGVYGYYEYMGTPAFETMVTALDSEKLYCSETYYKVENGDIIELWGGASMSGSHSGFENYFVYKIFAYEDDNEQSCLNRCTFQDRVTLGGDSMSGSDIEFKNYNTLKHDCATVWYNSGSSDYDEGQSGRNYYWTNQDGRGVVVVDNFEQEYIYLRFVICENFDIETLSASTPKEAGFIRVYPRTHYLKYANTIDDNSSKDPLSIQYWIIDDISIDDNGICPIKTVKAYSYEISLRDKWVTLSDSVINLYTPEAIMDLVSSDNFQTNDNIDVCLDGNLGLDKQDEGSGVNYSKECGYTRYQKKTLKNQKLSRGLLNIILDELPNWSIGYISPELMGRYRTFEENTSYNVYSLLTETAASLFQCFFIFDTKNLKINAYTKSDILQDSNLLVSYNNLLKECKINSSENKPVTKLHVHSADDTYSVSLVNPLGNDVIYNFDYYKDKLSRYTAPGETSSLYDKVSFWLSSIDDAYDDYCAYGKQVIESNVEVVKLQSRLEDIRAQYDAQVDILNSSTNKMRLPKNVVYTRSQITQFMNANDIHISSSNKELYVDANSARRLSDDYHRTLNELNAKRAVADTALASMKEINKSLQMKNIKDANDDLVFTANEIKILEYYTREGEWSNENAVFLEEYTSDDIYNTLIDLFSYAKSDMYDFIAYPSLEMSLDLANLFEIEEYDNIISSLFLGSKPYVEVEQGDWRQPVLTELHIDFSDQTSFQATFTTEYKSKPADIRFANLYEQLNTVSVSNTSYTYTEDT